MTETSIDKCLEWGWVGARCIFFNTQVYFLKLQSRYLLICLLSCPIIYRFLKNPYQN